MRIVHVVASDAFAGVERYVTQLASSQSRAGHDVTVVGGGTAHMAPELGRARHIEALSTTSTYRALLRLPAAADVVHVHMTASEVAAVVALAGRDVPVVSTRHFGLQRGRNAVVRRVLGPVSRRVDRQVAVSHYVAEHIDGPSVVVHPGVPDRDGLPAYADRERVVLVAQRLEREKHTSEAVDAFARSGLGGLGWRLDVAGRGAESNALQEHAARSGVAASVRWLGHRTDVAELMRRSRVLLATCPAEHFGLTVVEAMSCQLPVVAVGAAGHLETVGRVEGAALYQPGDVAGAAEWLRSLGLDEVGAASYARRLGEEQRRSFGLDRQRLEVDAVYRTVI